MRYKTDLIKKAKPGDDELRYPEGNTRDIIETVLYADKKAAEYTTLFAPTLKGRTLIDTCKNIWEFVQKQIPYKLDPSGEQYIKSPGRLWRNKAGDCKSFSLFTASCLRNLGIPYGYRFASYSKSDPTPTHVYVYVPFKDAVIILDSVWTGPFNTQKEFKHKQDHLMSKIAYLGGVGNPIEDKKRQAAVQARRPKHIPGVLKIEKPIELLGEEEFDLLLTRQRLEIEKANSAHIGGPFNWQQDKYDAAINTVNNALGALQAGDADYLKKMADHFDANGQPMIGSFFGKIWKGIKKVGKGIAKVAGKVGKFALKVVTFPLRMIAKLILEIYLPKAAGGFLYLFAAENTLPDKMRKKRKKSEGFKNFVCKKIGMKEKHFMGIIRNSLTKKLRMSPESYLAKIIKTSAVKGIGAIGYNRRRNQVNLQWNKKRKRKFPHTNEYIRGLEEHPDSERENAIIAGLSGVYGIGDQNGPAWTQFTTEQVQQLTQTADDVQQSVTNTQGGKGKKIANGILTAGAAAAMFIPGGQVVGPIIAAIQWIINKLGGKKEGVEMGAEDMPDPVADAGNAYNYGDLKNDYPYGDQQKNELKDYTSEAIDNGYDQQQATQYIKRRAPYLNNDQANELGAEAAEGYEPVTEEEGNALARQIKEGGYGNTVDELEKTGGGSRGGICKC